MPLLVRVFGGVFLKVTAPDMASDPDAAGERHPVFELVAQ